MLDIEALAEDGTALAIDTQDKNAETAKTLDESQDAVTVSFGEAKTEDDTKQVEAPAWVKELRKQNKFLAKQNRELQAAQQATTKAVVQLGEKPTLETCGYDEAKFEAELTAWHGRKNQVDEEARQRETEATAQRKAWEDTRNAYEGKKTALRVHDFSDAEDVVKDLLTTQQQAIILHGANDSAVIVYALGKHPDKAAELAAIKDPVKFAFAVARLEATLKITQKKAPQPERAVRGSAGVVGGDATLEKLRTEAEKTGNYTKVVAYKKQLKQK